MCNLTWKLELVSNILWVIVDPNKAHGHDKISICMIKICSTSISKPLRLIFNHCIDNGIYPCEWKKANVVEKNLKNIVQCLYFQFVVKFLKDFYIMRCLVSFSLEALISANQSDFKPGDSCINQLLWITHNIYKSFDDGYEVRDVFLEISKAFDKVWHDRLTFKIEWNIGQLMRSFETIFDK